ncbi:hypothetical protein CHU95_12335 [Niveispirillum lacus]|uniref:Uncharacterized protein n=1 Tax=Niveispirillum lacus TaxID=1981099 RepID=A0A255YYI7_9PROT|nr:hypothetical protein [Niveispirillum lacus]OYQ34231.1 hypothetical protein CHU95_12335 [Niveispirillum lacus]
MQLELSTSDIVILSGAAACLVAIVLLEMLRVVIPDIYEWVADHEKVKRETREAQAALEKLLARNRENAAQRDRRNAERFRMKSHVSRLEMTLSAVERDRVEVWHELGRQGVADSLFSAGVANRLLAEQAQRDFDSAPVIWRYTNTVRIWAPGERSARQMLATEFPADSGYAVQDLTYISSSSAGDG